MGHHTDLSRLVPTGPSAAAARVGPAAFDRIILQNLIGFGFGYSQGRGLRIAHSVVARMAGQPISAGGNVSLIVPGVSGDVVFDDDSFGYSGDDPFDMNSPLIRFTQIHQYWGEGPGAQELIINHNTFDGRGAHQQGFFALDVMAESTDFFSGMQARAYS